MNTLKKINNFFEHKKILVTGGTGLIGRQIVDILSNSNAKITVTSLDDLKLNSNVDYKKWILQILIIV